MNRKALTRRSGYVGPTLARQSRASARVAALVAAGAFGVHLFVQALLPSPSAGSGSIDYRHYYRPVAESLLAGNGLVTADGQPAVRYPPGYPMALTLPIGLARSLGVEPDVVVRLWAFALGGLTSALVFLCSRLFFAQRLSLLAAAAWTIYPPALWMFRLHSSEVLFTPLLLGALLLLFHAWRRTRTTWVSALLVGLTCGAAALCRPAAMGLGLVWAVLWLFQAKTHGARPLVGALLILVGNLAIVLPWEVASYRSLGRMIPLSTGGPPSIADGLTFGVRDRGYRTDIWAPDGARHVMQTVNAGYSPSMTSVGVLRLFCEAARESPLGASQLLALKATRCWYGTDSHHREGPLALIQLLFLPIVALGLQRAWRRGDQVTRAAAGVIAITTLYFWAFAMVGLSIARYMVPAVAMLMTLLPAIHLAQDS